MFILLAIFLLVLTPIAMVLFHRVRPRFSIQGFLAVLAGLTGCVMVLLAHGDIPQTIPLVDWEPASFFPTSPALMIDSVSWIFSLGIVSLSTGVIITSIARLGQSLRITPVSNSAKNSIDQAIQSEIPEKVNSNQASATEVGLSPNWRSWGGILLLTSFGLLAVTSGNMLTLLLAWTALDLTEIVILFGHIPQSQARERIVVAFSARMAGIGLIFLAGIIPWSQGATLPFDSISQSTSLYLILAAGLRLGVLPVHLPLIQNLPMRRGLGTTLRLIPAAASFILLARVANAGVLGPATPFLLGLTALAGLFGGFRWITAKDEINGRPYWLIGTASLAIASAILNHPGACIAWSIASILGGGLVFSMSIRNKYLIVFALLGLFGLSTLPFSPTWIGTDLYRYTSAISVSISALFFYLYSICFLFIQALLLSGYFRQVSREIYPPGEPGTEHIERWVWFLYPIGLIFIVGAQYLTGFLLLPAISEIPISGWVLGAAVVAISAGIGIISSRYPELLTLPDETKGTSRINVIFSLEWLYRILWQLFRGTTRFIGFISTVLEGEGGILWALVLFALIFVLLQR